MTDVNWKTHLRHWSERLEAFSVSLQPLFETVTTEDSNKSLGWFEKQRDLYPDYLVELVPEDLIGLSWWRPNDLSK
ncbi:MAG: hypothetical protein HOI70_09730, partial [Opitutae bacterium]|nr:hypothetical protein [Opitutae bacterium]